MADTAQPTPPPGDRQPEALPDVLPNVLPDALTYTTATDAQIAEARRAARRKLAESRQRHDAAYFERLRARFGVTANPA